MQVFPNAIVLTTKPHFDVCVNTRLGGENNSLRENPHKCYCVGVHMPKKTRSNTTAKRATAFRKSR